MTASGFTAFGHQFSGELAHWERELRDLEREGVTYAEFLLDDESGGPGTYRVSFLPAEIHQFVRGLVGWDQFVSGGFAAVSDRALAREAQLSAAERVDYDENSEGVCPADFFGADVEDLVCGGRLDRIQRVRAADPHLDALAHVLLVAQSLPVAVKALTERGDSRPSFELSSERDLQDLLFFALRATFDEVRREEWTPSAGGGSKRVDLVLPDPRLLIETKFVRNKAHGRGVADELRVDIESYHHHPACKSLVAIVWDPQRWISNPKVLERDLSGDRTKDGTTFGVVVRVI